MASVEESRKREGVGGVASMSVAGLRGFISFSQSR